MTSLADFVHVYEPAADPGSPTLLLLHGTGGDEHDLVPVGRRLAPGANILSPRGRVLERGMARFFTRQAPRVFDPEELRQRTAELTHFVGAAAGHYGFDAARVVGVGFSNGANMAACLLLLAPGLLRAAVLFSALRPIDLAHAPDLREVPVFITGGRADRMIEMERTAELAAYLQEAGATVEARWTDSGHTVTPEDVDAARGWLERQAL